VSVLPKIKIDKHMKYNVLNKDEERIIEGRGTEAPFSGEYCDFKEDGTFLCKRCNAILYKSVDKFDSRCGWPSFDDAVEGAVEKRPDPDGRRTEIVCGTCEAHLGHVFNGEGFTSKNVRHCVNSLSISFEGK
jgi:methionine-R-sulfoxide reductase